MTVPSDTGYDPTVHLNVKDIVVDTSKPSSAESNINQNRPIPKGNRLVPGKDFNRLEPSGSHASLSGERGPTVYIPGWPIPVQGTAGGGSVRSSREGRI